MKLATVLNWRIFTACLAVSFAVAWAVHWLSALGYWASWGIVMFAWIAVGISTLVDDDEPKASRQSNPENNRNA
jgi:hypothetical protein